MKDYRYTILCIDDEESILSALRRVLRMENYQIITATNTIDGLKLLCENEIHLVISDQRMPEISGTEFLAAVNDQFPDVVRIILSGYTDVDAITESVNNGHIYKFLLKPWNDQTLKREIKQALEYYELKRANKLLHEKVSKQNEKLKTYNEALEDMVRSRTEELIIKNQILELARTILEYLPIPIIGISLEGTIVLINQMAGKLSFSGRNLAVSNEIADYFKSSATKIFNDCVKSGESRSLKNYLVGNDTYDIIFTPLKGDSGSRGAILSLRLMNA
jgi:response regulator RpfG family c-di-GMP phosphodiesterase